MCYSSELILPFFWTLGEVNFKKVNWQNAKGMPRKEGRFGGPGVAGVRWDMESNTLSWKCGQEALNPVPPSWSYAAKQLQLFTLCKKREVYPVEKLNKKLHAQGHQGIVKTEGSLKVSEHEIVWIFFIHRELLIVKLMTPDIAVLSY